jgi:hypothetical protein
MQIPPSDGNDPSVVQICILKTGATWVETMRNPLTS